jgi:hypothetical protein
METVSLNKYRVWHIQKNDSIRNMGPEAKDEFPRKLFDRY